MTTEYTPMKSAAKSRVWWLGAVLTLENLAAVLHQSSRVYLYQQTLCLNYYKAHDPTQIDRTSQIPELLCKIPQVQSPLAITDGIDSFLSCIPVCRTNVYNYISGIYALATVSGSAIGSLLLSRHVYILNALSILCYIFTASVAATIPAACGRELEAIDESQSVLLAADPTYSPRSSLDRTAKSNRHSLVYSFLNSWKSSYLSIITLFNVPNPTFTVLLLFVINYFAVRVEVLLPQYTSLTLHWPLSTVNSVLALKALASALALFTLPSLRRRYLESRMSTEQVDLFITQMSLLANAIGMVCLGFSAPAAFFILALCLYTSGVGLADSLTSYGTSTLPAAEQIGDLYVRQGLISTLASMAGAPVWSGFFSLVLKNGTLPLGSPFWTSALLFGAGASGVALLNRRI
ncbi:MAG: hypothetical protein Q9182_004073 [Xanthomendoza sp. 2 TL-2023]